MKPNMYTIRNGSLYCSNFNKTGNVSVNVKLTHVRETIFAAEKQLGITYPECVCLYP